MTIGIPRTPSAQRVRECRARAKFFLAFYAGESYACGKSTLAETDFAVKSRRSQEPSCCPLALRCPPRSPLSAKSPLEVLLPYRRQLFKHSLGGLPKVAIVVGDPARALKLAELSATKYECLQHFHTRSISGTPPTRPCLLKGASRRADLTPEAGAESPLLAS